MNIYNYNHLFYFYVTAKLEGVTAAAKHLNTSQSSLSTQINTLESVLNKELFRKFGRKMQLTESGKELYNYCRRAFEVFDEMFDQINRKKTSMGVRVAIGVSVDIEKPFVTEILAKVTKRYTKGKKPLINLVSLQSAQLLQLLKIGEIDLLLTSNSGIDRELQTLSEFNLTVGAYVSAELLSKTNSDTVESAMRDGQLPLVLPSKLTNLRAEIDNYFMRKKLTPICVFESNIISAVIRAANDQMGITILPEAYVRRELRSEKLISISQKPLWRHKIALLSTRQVISQGIKDFSEILIQNLNDATTQSSLLK